MNKLPVITLTTDFGTGDGYAGSVKGSILSINPEASIIDINNGISPHDVFHASFLIKTVYSYFPKDTINLVIVDPGVGSNRKAIILKTGSYVFVAPDNGVLTYIAGENHPGLIHEAGEKAYSLHKVRVPHGLKVYEISNRQYWREPVSSTFHGRDIFGPVAAHISRGVSLSEFGREVNSIVVFNAPCLLKSKAGNTTGEVIYVDGFGNLVTNIFREDLPEGDFSIRIKDKVIPGMSKYYAEKAGLLALIGSSGYLEVAVKNGNAAKQLKAGFREKVKLVPL